MTSILLALTIYITFRYVRDSGPSFRSKWIVVGLQLSSVMLLRHVSLYLGLIVQVGTCAFILLYLKATAKS